MECIVNFLFVDFLGIMLQVVNWELCGVDVLDLGKVFGLRW